MAARQGGFPTVTIVTSGFFEQARATARSLGAPSLPLAVYPGVIMTDSREALRRKVEGPVVETIVEGFQREGWDEAPPSEPAPEQTVFKGDLDEVQEFFLANQWSDGLPIIPPTVARVERFLNFTDRPRHEVIGVLPPEQRESTIWNIAVNGVMAGCRPEYMPVLIAVVEAIADPEFRLEDAGATAGWDPLVILSGPIIKALAFNSGPGVLRIGRQANSSVGRFLRLYMRNVAGLRIPPGVTDKATIGLPSSVVLAEDEDAIAELGWRTFGADRGFDYGENVVTVQSVVGISPPIYTAGDSPADHLPTIAEVWGYGTCAYWSYTGMMFNRWFPLLVMSPSIAQVFAKNGWKKDDIRRYLRENVKIPAGQVERYAVESGATEFSISRLVEEGALSPEYALSSDAERVVPVFLAADSIGIIVAGDRDRSQARGFVNYHREGAAVSKKITLPARWSALVG